MIARAALIACAILLPATALAQSAEPPRYTRSGDGFVCSMDKPDLDKVLSGEKRDACLIIGPLYIGMPRAEAEKLLIPPMTSRETPDGIDYVHPLQDVPRGEIVQTYAVIRYGKDERVSVIQITGKPWPANWKFNGISLGATEAEITAILGKPKQVRDSVNPGFILWSYAPWTFSLELKDGALYSVRLYQ